MSSKVDHNEISTETLASLLNACDRVNRFVEDKLTIDTKDTAPIDIEVSIHRTKGMSGYSLIARILKCQDLRALTSYGEVTTITLTCNRSIKSFCSILDLFIEIEEDSKRIKAVK